MASCDGAAAACFIAQNTFLIDLSSPNFTPDWLEPDMAEQLRHSVEARLLLEAEYQQVIFLSNAAIPSHPLPNRALQGAGLRSIELVLWLLLLLL